MNTREPLWHRALPQLSHDTVTREVGVLFYNLGLMNKIILKQAQKPAQGPLYWTGKEKLQGRQTLNLSSFQAEGNGEEEEREMVTSFDLGSRKAGRLRDGGKLGLQREREKAQSQGSHARFLVSV